MARADRIKMELSNEDRKILRDICDALRAANVTVESQLVGRLVEIGEAEVKRAGMVYCGNGPEDDFGGVVPQEALDLPSASKVNRSFNDAGDNAV